MGKERRGQGSEVKTSPPESSQRFGQVQVSSRMGREPVNERREG